MGLSIVAPEVPSKTTHVVAMIPHPILEEKLLFIKKARPAWQAGRWNMPGGKVEPGETPEKAIRREVQEETGLDPSMFSHPEYAGCVRGSDGHKVDFFHYSPDNFYPYERMDVYDRLRAAQNPDETEPIYWGDWAEMRERPQEMVDSLYLIIPLMVVGKPGWELHYACSELRGIKLH